MKCDVVNVDGVTAIVCSSGRRSPPCACGKKSTKLCDWIVPGPIKHGKPKTCDAPLCDGCATSPAEGKDLCPMHTKLWAHHPANPNNASRSGSAPRSSDVA